jgi:GNAT superfamily N-acetyltransferase
MEDMQINYQAFRLGSASDHEYECLVRFKNLLRQEYYPDDPPMPAEEHIADWKTIPDFVEYVAYAGWNPAGTEIVAYCEMDVEHTGDNEHLAFFRIEILPEYRCRGFSREMLRMILPFATKNNRRLLMSNTSDRVPAAAIFMERIGARRGQESHINQLKVSEFDRRLMERWLQQGEPLASEFELGFWEGSFPEEHIVEVAALMQELANDQPRDALEMEDTNITPDFIRQMEKNMMATGEQVWTLYALDRNKGKLVGWTFVFWNPNRPYLLNQGFTAVDEAYRNKGLGRWLKATMIRKILDDRPQVEFIRTRNANSNAPMLKINDEMGFKPYISNTLWQVDTKQVEQYLDERKTMR